MTRIRSAAQRAPQTTEAATELLAKYAELSGALAQNEAERDTELVKINAAADAVAVPILAELKDIAKQLQPWWEASRETLTAGKRKSIELGGCTVGYRISPPKLHFEYGTDANGIEALTHFGRAEAFTKTTVKLDKPAILRDLGEEPDDALVPLELIGFEPRQSEDFFIEPVGRGPLPA